LVWVATGAAEKLPATSLELAQRALGHAEFSHVAPRSWIVICSRQSMVGVVPARASRERAPNRCRGTREREGAANAGDRRP
jgi:hypothetical protein